MNIMPQPETAVNAVVAACMSTEEARQCIDEIKTHLNSSMAAGAKLKVSGVPVALKL